jgi:5,10-methylenetetrahydromethanopterin reductase
MSDRRGVELWNLGGTLPGRAAETARCSEDAGYDGHSFGDTQCLSADPFVNMTVAAAATQLLKLSVRVTNPRTRHPATTACATATVHLASAGRVVLGIGRGDSAVAQLGMRAATVAELEQFTRRVKAYLRGGDVEIDGHRSALHWLRDLELPAVPIEVAGTGPAVIAAGARVADQIGFNMGADPTRLRRGIAWARNARKEAGLDPDILSFGAFVNVAPHGDIGAARDLVKGTVATYARFSAMTGRVVEGVAPSDAPVMSAVAQNYDRSRHARSSAAHTSLLPAEFIDRFAIVGEPGHCVERLAELVSIGLDRLEMVGISRDAPPEIADEARHLLTREVFPRLRAEFPAVPRPSTPTPLGERVS